MNKMLRRRTDLALEAAEMYYNQTGRRVPSAKVYNTYTTDEDEYTPQVSAKLVVSRMIKDTH